MNQYRVTAKWIPIYNNPIQLMIGEEVLVDPTRVEDNPNWEGWVWCT